MSQTAITTIRKMLDTLSIDDHGDYLLVSDGHCRWGTSRADYDAAVARVGGLDAEFSAEGSDEASIEAYDRWCNAFRRFTGREVLASATVGDWTAEVLVEHVERGVSYRLSRAGVVAWEGHRLADCTLSDAEAPRALDALA